ncbi:MAG: SurA N-terminal domain-containing protein [Acidimicrobiales bacterium]
MERRPALVRRAVLAALALLLVAAGAGCSDSDRVGTRTAASVGDVDITQDQVVALMQGQIAYAERLEAATKKAAKASPDDATAQQQVEQASSTRQQITETFAGTGAQAGTDSVGTEGAAQVLSTMIQVELMKQAARDAGVKVSDSEIADARTSIEQSISADGVTSTKGFEELVATYAELQAYQKALTTHFASTGEAREAQLQAAFDAALGDQSQYCINLIATPDQASALAAYARVQGGEDFLAVGNEVSLDKDTLAEGKELCITGTQLFGVFQQVQPPVAEGTILAPVDGQGSWIFVRVVRTQVPTFEQLRPQLEANTPDADATSRVQEALAKAQKRADITVDPRYGTWDAATGVVSPPEAEPSGTTTSTAPASPSTTAGS